MKIKDDLYMSNHDPKYEIDQPHDPMHELGQMAAVMAHEIGNALGGIQGFASLLERDLEGQLEKQKMVQHISAAAEDIHAMVASILDYSKPLDSRAEDFDAVKCIQEVVENLEASPSFDPRVRIVLQLPHQLMVNLDPTLFRSILYNLLTNALQAMPQGGCLTVILSCRQQKMVLKVQDTGVGISQENKKKVFYPFFTTKVKGHGFGLAQVARIAQKYKGSVHVDSQVGVGSCFTVELPLKFSKVQR